MFSISKFKNNLQIVRPNLFFAEVDLPTKLASIINGKVSTDLSGSAVINGTPSKWFRELRPGPLNDTFRLRCEVTEMPGKTVATSDDMAYGPTTKHAYDLTYSDINLQIIASEDMRERAFFEIWMENSMYATNLSGGVKGKGGLSRYYDDYARGQVRIFQLNSVGKVLARYTLFNAFPIQMSPMNMTWEETNTYQRFTITMTYRFHVADFNQGFLNIT
jgi:hypothetical protein